MYVGFGIRTQKTLYRKCEFIYFELYITIVEDAYFCTLVSLTQRVINGRFKKIFQGKEKLREETAVQMAAAITHPSDS